MLEPKGKEIKMARLAGVTAACTIFLAAFLVYGQDPLDSSEAIWHYRNLGKAFYENPMTPREAVEWFQKALELAPDSPRERLNYGLALLEFGQTEEGIAELEKVQQQAPEIPHTWFNLGIAYKRQGQYQRSREQFEQMVELVPEEPVPGGPEPGVNLYRETEFRANPDTIFGPVGPFSAIA